MTKFFKENKKMLLRFLAIAIIFPIIILLPSPIGIIPYETGLTLIGYGGSILGGFLTLYGVWWTIEDNNKQRIEDFVIQYKPLLFLKKLIIDQLKSMEILFYTHKKIKNLIHMNC